MAEDSFDVVVIGGGPGGYVCAIKAAQLGLKTACIEKRGALGGTCLNVGCIPSKALLTSSHKYAEAAHDFAAHGIKVGKLDLDLKTMMDRKNKVVGDLTKGVEFLFKKNKVTYLKGTGKLLGGGKIEVSGEKAQAVSAKSIIIATGSDVTPLPGVAIDEKQIVSSTGALSLEKVPEHLVVIGGGVIGLEMGSVWLRLGAKVTVVEFLDRIVPSIDTEVSTQFQRVLTKQGMTFKLGTKVTSAKSAKGKVTLSLEPAKGGAKEELVADAVLVAIGRKPYTEGLGLDTAGVALDEKGRIKTDHHFQTNVPGIYAIGDVIAGPMLAHKAEEEGVAIAEMLAGQAGHVNYETVPNIVYTWPELASVGKSEDELKAAGVDYKIGKFPFLANSRAKANADTDGLVKLIADAKTDRLLGAHVLGPDAGTLIHECVMAMEFHASAEDVARAFHGHPTFNEAIKEAALAIFSKAIHI
ncbi:MAG: dihydrolipoyl dehydrogenase [Rhodospirillaceae bacterium]|nr:MAG: dihydrolipoyl dehydrogenase [Rhodospirillaceae bacterium]